MAKRAHNRTTGGYLLARTGKAQTQIAIEIGVSKVTAHQWISGEKRPGKPTRSKLRAAYGIAEEAWDEEHQPQTIAPAPRMPQESLPNSDGLDTQDLTLELLQEVRAQLDQVKSNGNGWTPMERARVSRELSVTVIALAKSTGQFELGRKMMSLPIWKQAMSELFAALSGFPDASKAVADRLEAFERAWLGKVG